jgi:HEAT repeat protein
MEAKVLEFLDQAVDLGLLSSEFELNDETIRFISKRVLEVIYGTIQTPDKQELHERVGSYQESLYQKSLLPSASILAYHFKRSTRQEKARRYEQLQLAQNSFVFNAEEAVHYSGDNATDETYAGPPLTPASRVQLPSVLRWMLTAVNNVKLYPAESEAIRVAARQLKSAIEEILVQNEFLNLHRGEQWLMVNGEPMDVIGCELVAEGALGLLRRLELKGIAFHRCFTEDELQVLLEAFGHTRTDEIDQRFWLRFSRENRMLHINLKQLRYTEVEKRSGGGVGDHGGGKEAVRDVAKRATRATAGEVDFGPEERAWIREVIRGLLGVSRGIRLYPLKSKAISAAIEQLLQALREILGKRRVLTLAAAEEALLVNGVRLGGPDVEKLANGFIQFIGSIKLSGLTFLESISIREIETFVGALRQPPAVDEGAEFWKRLAAEEGISSIRFDESVYKVGEAPTLVAEVADVSDELFEGLEEADEEDISSEESFAEFLATLPRQVDRLLLDEDSKELHQLIEQLFQGLGQRPVLSRKKAVDAYRASLKNLSLGFQHEFARVMTEPMLIAFAGEEHPDVFREMVAVLHRMAGISIQFSDYALACRILSQLHGAHRLFERERDARTPVLAKLLDRKLEPGTQELLVEDLNSMDPVRQQAAARVLACVGRVAVPLLVDVVKGAKEGRARQIAGSLLAEVEEEAGELLKRALVQEPDVGQRVRILDVIDTVTRDVNAELARCLTDENPQVCQAALRLAERLNDRQVVEMLLEHARGQETELATTVIRWFGKLKAKGVVQEIVSILNSTEETERVVACCHALGQSGDAAGVEALERILAARGFFPWHRHWSPEARAAAATALSKIPHPPAAEVLSGFVKDRDPTVRRIAQSGSEPRRFPPLPR